MEKKKIIIITAVAVAVIAVILAVVLFFGGRNTGSTGNTGDTQGVEPGTPVDYEVVLRTEGGVLLSGIELHVYEDDTLDDLQTLGKTDAEGRFTFNAPASDDYVVVIVDELSGYPIEKFYKFSGLKAEIVLKAQLLSVEELSGHRFQPGGVFADMEVVDTEGKTHKISQILKEKKAVVLNFWFLTCDPCKEEFPYLEAAYKKYKDTIEVLAVNTVNNGEADLAELVAFKENYGLSFPVCQADGIWAEALALNSYPTTVVIDRFGTISFKYEGGIPSTAIFENMFAFYSQEDGVQCVIRKPEDFPEVTPLEDGTVNAPYTQTELSFDIELASGQEIYYQMYKVSGMNIEIADPSVYVIYEGTKYEPVDGVVNVPVRNKDTYSPVVFAVGNTASTTTTISVHMKHPLGAMENPFALNIGDVVAKTEAGNEVGVYYVYTAKESGIFTVTNSGKTPGPAYGINVYNLNTYEFKDADSTGEEPIVLSVQVNAGDQVRVNVGALMNHANEFPEVSVDFNVSFKKEDNLVDKREEYTVQVVDTDGKGIANVSLSILLNGSEISTIVTDENGVAKESFMPSVYKVKVSAPKGYEEDKTEYMVTATNKSITITLKKEKIVTYDYTVTVVDENQKPIKDAVVVIGNSTLTTDAKGVAKVTLNAGSYSATASADGYDAVTKSFGNDSVLTITLTKKASQETEKTVDYKVTVVNDKGVGQTGIKVTFTGNQVVVVDVNSNGEAVANLPQGNYKVTLSCDNYDSSNTMLTSSKTSATIMVGTPVTSYGELYEEMTPMVNVGGTYVKLVEGMDNYFLFQPIASGTYSFTTSSPQAIISYYGANLAFVYDQTGTTDYANNKFTLNVKESNIGSTYVLKVEGVTDTVLVVKREGNAVIGVEDLPYTEYTGTHTPSKFTNTETGKLTYVNVAGEANIVLGTDGYYHYGSATGPIVYVNLHMEKYLSIYNMVNPDGINGLGTGMQATFYDANGNFVKKESYTTCLTAYLNAMDQRTCLYPLTEDLMYIIKEAGAVKGWYTSGHVNYLFGENQVNTEIAWMFACCYYE